MKLASALRINFGSSQKFELLFQISLFVTFVTLRLVWKEGEAEKGAGVGPAPFELD